MLEKGLSLHSHSKLALGKREVTLGSPWVSKTIRVLKPFPHIRPISEVFQYVVIPSICEKLDMTSS